MNFPSPPRGLQTGPGGQDPGFDQWLFVFWSWIKKVIGGILPGTAGTIIYTNSTGDGLTSEAAFAYNETTNTLAVVNIDATGKLSLAEISDPGLADANESWIHAEDVAGVTQLQNNDEGYKWTFFQDAFTVVRNTSGGSLPKGTVCRLSGATGVRPEIAAADADLHHRAVGLLAETLANNAYGRLITNGMLRNFDTSAWTAGTALYLSGTLGGLTSTAPTFPASKQVVGSVINQHATQGLIFVNFNNDDRRSDGSWNTPFSIGDGATAGELRLLEPSGVQYTAFKAQAQAGNVTYILPAADAAVSGYALKSDGAGNLSWGPSGGSDTLAFAARHG